MKPALACPLLASFFLAGAAHAKVDFEKQILPLLEKSCVECHRAPYEEGGRLKNPKGGLRLDAAWAISLGGENGAVLTPGDPEKSELYVRTTLPEDDDDFMPPKGTKWSKADQEIVAAWIREGAGFGDWTGNLDGKPVGTEGGEEAYVSRIQLHYEALARDLAPASPDAIARVEAAGGRVIPLAKDNPLLEVDFLVQRDETTDEKLEPLLAVGEQLAHLDLSRTRITDASLAHLKGLPRLTRLNLHGTEVGDAGLAHLGSLPNLTYLNLYGTRVTDAGLVHLARLKKLRNVYLWGSQVTPAGVQKLRKQLPGADINFK